MEAAVSSVGSLLSDAVLAEIGVTRNEMARTFAAKGVSSTVLDPSTRTAVSVDEFRVLR